MAFCLSSLMAVFQLGCWSVYFLWSVRKLSFIQKKKKKSLYLFPFVLKDLGILKISKNLAELPSPEKKSQVNLTIFSLSVICN
jgi:hypothetical protein